MRKVIQALVAKGTIPGVRGDGDALVAEREAPAVQAEKARAARRAGARTGVQKVEDASLRSYGVPVFDRRAGQAELSGYLGRARSGQK